MGDWKKNPASTMGLNRFFEPPRPVEKYVPLLSNRDGTEKIFITSCMSSSPSHMDRPTNQLILHLSKLNKV
jgi:hypothetical protein